jgi:RNA-binding protein Luc7-like 2
MAYDAVRRQLDQLMGTDRNELPSAKREKKDTIRYDDPRVCKHYLLGLCPSTLTVRRRGDAGTCSSIHDNILVKRFEEDKAAGRVPDLLRWQTGLAQACRAIVADEDRRIQGVARRLRDTYGCEDDYRVLIVKGMDSLKALGLLDKNALPGNNDDDRGDDGHPSADDDDKQEATTVSGVAANDEDGFEIKILSDVKGGDKKPGLVEGVSAENKAKEADSIAKQIVERPLSPRRRIAEKGGISEDGLSLEQAYKQRVCGACGGLLSLFDAQSRLLGHFGGKAHVHALLLRKKMTELDDIIRRSPPAMPVEGQRPGRFTPAGSSHQNPSGRYSRAGGAGASHLEGGYIDDDRRPRARSRSRSQSPLRSWSRNQDRDPSRSPLGGRNRARSRSPMHSRNRSRSPGYRRPATRRNSRSVSPDRRNAPMRQPPLREFGQRHPYVRKRSRSRSPPPPPRRGGFRPRY